jgi:hypothetical protein
MVKKRLASKNLSWVWWCALAIPALGRRRQRQKNWESSRSFRANIARVCLKKFKRKKGITCEAMF